MARKIPCLYCKQRRRKCERSCETEPCERCIRMNRDCLLRELSDRTESSDEDDYLNEYDDNVELKSMNQQVEILEYELKNLELSLNKHKQNVKEEPVWDIEFVNGQLLLKSEIKSLEELMLYGRSVIRYLSPFGNVFKSTLLKFGRKKTSFVVSAMHIANAIELREHNEATSPAVISRRFTPILVEFIKPESLVDLLVDNFFHCLNDTAPLLHEPSFREHYNRLEDPLTDPITLAICTSASIFTCRHSSFVSNEKRYFGEYFFKMTIDKLTDIFDDPEKELESLVVINLIQMFMITTLRINESKKWATISTILANSLQNRYPDCFKGNDSLPMKTRILYTTIHRNSILSECFLNILDFITSKRNDEFNHAKIQVDILPDESDAVKELLTMMNHIFRLALHPLTMIIVTQVRKMVAGEMAELNFEEIVQYEEVVADWWHSLPDELKICKEPYNCTDDLISKTEDMRKLIMVGYIYTVTLSIQSCLITPLYREELETVNNTVKDRAIHLVMYSADMIMLISKKLESIDTVCYSPARLLIRSIDSIMSLLEVNDSTVAQIARDKLDEYMYELSQNVLKDHQVSQDNSPFKLITNAQPGNKPSITELYQNYPLPGEALMYDIILNTVKRDRE